MRERKSERFNIIFLSHFVQLMEKKMKNTHLATLYSILFRLVLVTECIINLGRERKGERKGGREGRERELNIFLAIKAKLLIQ